MHLDHRFVADVISTYFLDAWYDGGHTGTINALLSGDYAEFGHLVHQHVISKARDAEAERLADEMVESDYGFHTTRIPVSPACNTGD